jgi:hypothetical protein
MRLNDPPLLDRRALDCGEGGQQLIPLKHFPIGLTRNCTLTCASPAGLTRILLRKTFCEEDGLPRNAGLPAFRNIRAPQVG